MHLLAKVIQIFAELEFGCTGPLELPEAQCCLVIQKEFKPVGPNEEF